MSKYKYIYIFNLLNEICIIFKYEYIENERKFNYLILTNFIILKILYYLYLIL